MSVVVGLMFTRRSSLPAFESGESGKRGNLEHLQKTCAKWPNGYGITAVNWQQWKEEYWHNLEWFLNSKKEAQGGRPLLALELKHQ